MSLIRWRPDWRTLALALGLTLILALAAYLRLVNVAENPGWYSDEGTDVEITLNLLHGKTQYLAITQSTLLVARPPLFHWLLAGMFRLFGAGIGTLRVFTASLNVLSVLLLYVAVRLALGREGTALALLAALMLAIYPQAILYSRIGYIYNFLTPLVLLSFLGLSRYLENGRAAWLALSALALGVGAVAVLMMLTVASVLIAVVAVRRWRDLFWCVPLLVLPFGIYASAMLLTVPQAFVFDLNFVLFRLGAVPWLAQLTVAALNYAALLAQDYWFAPAMVGLFLLRPPRWQGVCLLSFFLPMLALARAVSLSGLGLYYISPLFPFVALGVASLVRYGAPWVTQIIRGGVERVFRHWQWAPTRFAGQWLQARLVGLSVGLGLFFIIAAPFLMMTWLTAYRAQTGFHSGLDPVLVSPQDARQVTEFVNANAGRDDLVIASPTLAWLFHTRVADFQLAVAATGRATMHFPANIPADRFAFDPRYSQARFVVIDNVWRHWAVLNMPEVKEMLHEVETWPPAFTAGQVEVYRNPAK